MHLPGKGYSHGPWAALSAGFSVGEDSEGPRCKARRHPRWGDLLGLSCSPFPCAGCSSEGIPFDTSYAGLEHRPMQVKLSRGKCCSHQRRHEYSQWKREMVQFSFSDLGTVVVWPHFSVSSPSPSGMTTLSSFSPQTLSLPPLPVHTCLTGNVEPTRPPGSPAFPLPCAGRGHFGSC